MNVHLQKQIFFTCTHDIIIEYVKLCHTYIIFFNKTISICLLLLLIPFLKVFFEHLLEF